MNRAFFVILNVLAWSLSGPARGAAQPQDLWIENVTIVSPERAAPLEGASVHIHGERIAEITAHGKPASARRVLDGRGLFLTPGLIDSHVHLREIPGMNKEQEGLHPDVVRTARAQFPESYLYFGFTTLIDLISVPEVIKEWAASGVHPDTYFCGGVPVQDGYPSNYVPASARYQYMPYFLVEPANNLSLPPGTDAASHTPSSLVSRIKADGAICVKAFYEHGFGDAHNLPVPRLGTIQELVRAAHAAGMPIVLHANSSEAQTFGLAAGVDIFAHGLWKWDEPWQVTEPTAAIRKILDTEVQNKRGLQSTIQVLYGERDLFNDAFFGDPRLDAALPSSLIAWYKTPDGQWFHDVMARAMGIKPGEKAQTVDGGAIARVKNCVAYLAKSDARFLFGSDTPSGPTYANPPGLNGRKEIRDLIDAGLTPAQVFRAATLSNADAFGLSAEVGTVQVGKRANLLLLHADPSKTADAYDGIAKVILRGQVLEPRDLAANRLESRPPG
jgi:imidazolonepropionase-like amidohydrolase